MRDQLRNVDLDRIHVCEEKPLPQALLLEAAELARAENPENAPSGELNAARPLGVDPLAPETFGALLTGKKWQVGRRLRVRHLGGEAVRKRVEHFARQWEAHANISFNFVQDANAEIRISYHLDGRSWSYLGTDALAFPQDQETMHFGWLTAETTDDEVRRTVVHEFGHALGMIHEHQHPGVQIKWKKDVVYRYYAEKMGWTKAMVDRNLFQREGATEATQFDEYDPLSIMHYPIDPGFTENGIGVGLNTELSDTDKRFIARVYPKPAPAAALPPSGAAPAVAPHVAAGPPLRGRWNR